MYTDFYARNIAWPLVSLELRHWQFFILLNFILFLLLGYPVWTLYAQDANYRPNVPNAPAQPSSSVNNPNVNVPGRPVSNSDPNFPQLELAEPPLEVPRSLRESGSGLGRSELLYRNFILEALFGYYGMALNLYNIDSSTGNSQGNTRESYWSNLYNLLVGAQLSGNIRKFHYNVWFGLPLSLNADYVQLHNYDFGNTERYPAGDRNKNDLSYQGNFPNKDASHLLFLGELKAGLSIVERKSAKLILGGGVNGLVGESQLMGGTAFNNLVLTSASNISKEYPDNTKTISLFAAQVLPFVYLQGGVFLTSFLEIFASLGYSPATLWVSEENRFYSDEISADKDRPYRLGPTQYRRYGYFGQTILGEFQARLWLARRFALKIGIKGRLTLKTTGTLRTYKLKDGELENPDDFVLSNNSSAMQHLQISAFIGFGMTFDSKLPPGREYVMPF